MPLLPGLAVVFVGLLGKAPKVDHQLKAVVRALHVATAALPSASLKALTHHAGNAQDIARKLHADGIVSCEISGGMLRLVIYDGDGKLATFMELPLGKAGLADDDLEVLRSTIADDVATLRHEPAPAPPPAPPPADDIQIDAPPPPAPPPPAPPPLPKVAKHVAAAPKAAPIDDEVPSSLGGGPQPLGFAPTPAASHQPAPVETASVSVDEIEAMTGGGGDAPELHAAAPAEASLHLGASIGLGLTSRSFAAGPATVAGYASTPVGMVHFDGHLEPTARTSVAIVAERTLAMTTPLHDGMASTTSSRWEAIGGYALIRRGAVEIGPRFGIGRRAFSIDSTDPSRAPDGDYNYLIAGLAASTALGSHVAIRGVALFEPVVSGVEPTEMALGEASRWALDLGVAVELRRAHLYARGAVDYQRFAWSWDMAGARGAGGAVDSYPSGTLSLGADY